MTDSAAPPLPEGTKPLSHQVAGHFFGKGKHKYGFLESEDGKLLKPVQSPPRGPRELKFYQQVFDPECSDFTLLKLRPLLPAYLGTWSTPTHPGVTYFRLDDITKKFKHPNILDVKIGPITYDPDATPEKRAQENSKYPPLPKVRFQLIGMRIYDPETKQHNKVERTFLRSLDENQILWQGLAHYVNYQKGSQRHRPVVHYLLQHLQDVKHWFENQRQLAFYASSLLLVHEASATQPIEHHQPNRQTDFNDSSSATMEDSSFKNNSDFYNNISDDILFSDRVHNGETCSDLVDARMIDFAHVFPSDVRDDNYLSGLNSLISYFERLLKA